MRRIVVSWGMRSRERLEVELMAWRVSSGVDGMTSGDRRDFPLQRLGNAPDHAPSG